MMDMPIGVTMAFAENLDSFKYFSSLTPLQQQNIIDRARMLPRQELKGYIQNLEKGQQLL
jgi:hypothetical protein